MICAWNELINLLPMWLRQDVDRLGKDSLQELRLRLNRPPELIMHKKTISLYQTVSREDLVFCINMASKYSPWSASTISQGYLTAAGGHRIGICGEGIEKNRSFMGIRAPTSLCIRVARDFSGISDKLDHLNGSVLIIGKPGSGKTTLLRDLIRKRSGSMEGSISVVDEKGEVFPISVSGRGFDPGPKTDVLTGCSKTDGIPIALRNMGPSVIAVDEITAASDCDALIQAGWCGVSLIATAHASCRKDLLSRPVYAPIIQSGLFDHLVVMKPDKSYTVERIAGC